MANNTATVSSVAGSATAVTLFAAGAGNDAAARTVFNDSTADLYVKFGATASATDFTVKIPAGGYYEVPAPVYDGLITGIWTSATGSARLTQVDA
jgi:hypothetical protein